MKLELLRKKFPGNDDLEKNRRKLADLKSLRTHSPHFYTTFPETNSKLSESQWLEDERFF